MRRKILLVFSSYRSHLRIPRHLGAPSCSNRPNPHAACRAGSVPNGQLQRLRLRQPRRRPGLRRCRRPRRRRAVDWRCTTAARSLAARACSFMQILSLRQSLSDSRLRRSSLGLPLSPEPGAPGRAPPRASRAAHRCRRDHVEPGQPSNWARDSGASRQLLQAAIAEMRLSESLPGDGVKERIALQLERLELRYSRKISLGTGVLATIGSTAPFVGLFGTVWGIMNSFIGISNAHTTNLAVVAPGIAEALLGDRARSGRRHPAVVVYNVLVRSTAHYARFARRRFRASDEARQPRHRPRRTAGCGSRRSRGDGHSRLNHGADEPRRSP